MIASARSPLTYDPTVLERVLARVRALPGAVVVFDLDSTLLDNRPRQARILREFGAARGIPALAARADRALGRLEHPARHGQRRPARRRGRALGRGRQAVLARALLHLRVLPRRRRHRRRARLPRRRRRRRRLHRLLHRPSRADARRQRRELRAPRLPRAGRARAAPHEAGVRALRRRLEDRGLRAPDAARRRRRRLRQRADPRQRLPRRLPRGHGRAPRHRRLGPPRDARRRHRQHQGLPPPRRA